VRLAMPLALTCLAVVTLTFVAAISASSALAVTEVALCKELVEAGKLCPKGKLWPSGSKLLGLAKETVLHDEAQDVDCEDSTIEVKTTAESGSSLPIEVTALDFGELPVPSLGAGCTGCTAGIHAALPFKGSIEVTEKDDFWLATSGSTTFLKCFSGIAKECVYGSSSIKPLIEHKGSHSLHEGSNLAVVLIATTLEKKTGSAEACPETGLWLAKYVFYLIDSGSEKGLAWPALVSKEENKEESGTVVLCKELIEKGKLCPEGKLWAEGAKLLLLAKEPVLEGTLTVKCEDSIATATLGTPNVGLLPVSMDVVFGKLPTPKLGEGCTGCKEVHVPLTEGWVKVKGEDEFYLEVTGAATFLHCTVFNVTCVYGVEGLQTPIKHDGTHPLHEGTNLALLKFEVTLLRKEGSSGLCSAEGLWKATYTTTLVDQGTETGLGWPALDKS
jgi:hypothetical protein